MADYDKLLQVPRGTKERLEQIKLDLLVNTIVYATDTKELGIKLSDGNIEYFKNATDINTIVDSKQNKLTAGSNITINPITNVISASGSGGGGGDGIDLDTFVYMNYAADIFNRGGHYSLFSNAWQDMKNSETVLFDIPLTLAAPNQEMGGFTIDIYVGTNEQLQALYDACANETIPPPINNTRGVYYVNNVATFYVGDMSEVVSFPIPLYTFGNFGPDDNDSFAIGDLTPLSMGLGLILAKFVNVSIPNNSIVIQQGFEFENENGIIIPDSVTSIGDGAFSNWTSNNQPLVIPNSVTSIGYQAFDSWLANNQPLTIPNSVTSIGDMAFWGWNSAKEFIMESETPPTIDSSSFYDTNNAPFYVPDGSVEAYKTATNWVVLANRIFPMSDRTGGGGSEYELTKSKIDTALRGSSSTSIQLGEGANASRNGSAAVGDNASASASFSTALGYGASASGHSSTALGRSATASETDSTALGYGAIASGNYSTALGRSASALGNSSIALGLNAFAEGLNSIAIGSETEVFEDNVVDFGSIRQVRVNETPVNDRDAVSKKHLENIIGNIDDILDSILGV